MFPLKNLASKELIMDAKFETDNWSRLWLNNIHWGNSVVLYFKKSVLYKGIEPMPLNNNLHYPKINDGNAVWRTRKLDSAFVAHVPYPVQKLRKNLSLSFACRLMIRYMIVMELSITEAKPRWTLFCRRHCQINYVIEIGRISIKNSVRYNPWSLIDKESLLI